MAKSKTNPNGKSLESWIWDAACSIRGAKDAAKYKDYILPLIFADYVIVHELLHFFVPNHGKLWKSLMRAHLGEWEALEEELTAGNPQ